MIDSNNSSMMNDDLTDFHLNKIRRKISLRISRNKSPPKMHINGQFVDSNNNSSIFDEEGEQRKTNMIKRIQSRDLINYANLKPIITTKKSSLQINGSRAHCEGSQVRGNQYEEIKKSRCLYSKNKYFRYSWF